MGKSPVAGGGGGRAARALRFALLIVLALAAVEYIYSYVLETSPLRTYIYPPFNYNNTERGEVKSSTNKESTTIHKLTSLKPISPKIIPIENKPLVFQNNIITSPNSTVIAQNISVIPISEATSATESTPKEITTLLNKLVKVVSSTSEPSVGINLTNAENNDSVPICKISDDLGPVTANKTENLSLQVIDRKYPEVSLGGIHTQPNCSTADKVAIIVPFRDRQQHLAIFLNHIHPFLLKQPIEYGIYVVEQQGISEFNRAKLFNVGYTEAQRLTNNGWNCLVFHDVDLLPLDTRNLYTCPKQPRHMSVAIDTMGFRLPYQGLFGGVSALTTQQFKKLNGFSNRYWGWGGEDDDISNRVRKKGFHIARYKTSIARYAMLHHKKSHPNPKRYKLLSETAKSIDKDGLSNLNYKLIKVQKYHLFTHILANIDEKS